MKKSIFLVLFILIFTLLPVIVFAEEDIDTETVPSEKENITELIGSHCLCGRDYYTDEVDGHSVFDCTKCGQNMYVCTCNCWCGAATVIDTSGDYGATIPRICTGCGKPCILCDCRNDREAVLFAEQQRRAGEISALNILRPQNALIPVIAVAFAALLAALCVLADKNGFFEKLINRIPEVIDRVTDNGIEETDHVTEDNSTKAVIGNENHLPPVEKKTVNIKENKSSGVYRLYKTVAVLDTNKTPKSACVPSDEPDLTFSSEELSALLKVTKTRISAISPFAAAGSNANGDILANLILEGLITKTEDGFRVEDNIGRYISEIADPKTFISFDTVFSGKYSFCTSGSEWYATDGKDEVHIRIFSDINALCEWISVLFDSNDKDKTIPSADILFSYKEFSLYALTQILGHRESFRKEDVMRPDVCSKIKDSLYSEGFMSTAKTFDDLAIEDETENTMDEMEKKGLLFESNGTYTCSKTVSAVLANDQIRECVHLTKKGSYDFEILFAIRENGAAAIYDTGSDVRILSAKNIPWKQYMG